MGEWDAALIAAHGSAEGEGDVAAALRKRRSAEALALGVADLSGAFSLEKIVSELSALADEAMDTALAAAIRERTPGAPSTGFTILALGKLGSRELNYSSDIDLIFLYDPETLPRREREEPQQAALRIGRRVVELLQNRDGNGYVFRVDLRLRPSPEVTPIVLAADAAISYYETSALPWERAAFIRARAAAGDKALGQAFLDAIHPFVWRRSLDYGAIGELQAISRRIRDHYVQGQAFGPGFDLKRGRGGIREIEFFAQIHQLIHGGRDPGLRAPATLDALAALKAAGHIEAGDADALIAAYRLFRTIEHRLQMVEDRQTHTLPAGEALDNVACLHGLADGEALLTLLAPHVDRVASIYGRLDSEEEDQSLPGDGDALEARLAAAGFPDPASARQRIESWRSGTARSLRTPAAREAFEAMLPVLVQAFGASPDPAHALNRFDDIVQRLPGGVNFYRLLEARPALTSMLASILAHATVLAEQLGRRPELLDGLIDASAFDPMPPVADLAAQFGEAERAGEDYEQRLDLVRRRVNDRRFALGAQIVLGMADPLEAAAGYARVAEAAIEVLVRATIEAFEERHGKVPESEFAILGLGRLGGAALTDASDLDLIYLFTGTHEAESDGPKPLRATDYFNRLAQRVTAALSVPTAAGALYQVDTRLRPSGAKGLLAVSLESFAAYQRDQAWTWEHMAMTRARPVFGSPEARAALGEAVEAVLRMPRDEAKVRADAAAMRRDMARHKPPVGSFDIKLGPGGLVDLEFAIHALQLVHHEGLDPRLEPAIAGLVAAGLAPPEVEEAHRLLARMLVTFRLVSPSSAEPHAASRALVARACGLETWEELVAAHDDARHSIGAFWRDVAGEEMERDDGGE